MTETRSAAFLLSLLLLQVTSSIGNGLLTARMGSFKPQIIVGFMIWLVGIGCQVTFNLSTPLWSIPLVLVVQGIGVGATLQNIESFNLIRKHLDTDFGGD